MKRAIAVGQSSRPRARPVPRRRPLVARSWPWVVLTVGSVLLFRTVRPSLAALPAWIPLRSMSTAPTRPAVLDPAIFNRALYSSILDFWFADIPEGVSIPDRKAAQRWFGLFNDPADKVAFDTTCGHIARDALDALGPQRFPLPAFTSFAEDRRLAASLSAPLRANLVQVSAADAAGQQPLSLAHATLALVLLLDQFSRNTLRDLAGQAVVFQHYDRLSRALVHSVFDDANSEDPVYGVDRHSPLQHSLAQRGFFYLPLQHSEDLADHDLIEQRREDLTRDGSEEEKQYLAKGKDYDRRHRSLLERFGRYPHRNAALGREPTAEETKFLEEGGDTFGVSQDSGSKKL